MFMYYFLIVDGVRVATFASEGEAHAAALRQPFGSLIRIKPDCHYCSVEFCPVTEGLRSKCPYMKEFVNA